MTRETSNCDAYPAGQSAQALGGEEQMQGKAAEHGAGVFEPGGVLFPLSSNIYAAQLGMPVNVIIRWLK